LDHDGVVGVHDDWWGLKVHPSSVFTNPLNAVRRQLLFPS
jgi:hypothetical protein